MQLISLNFKYLNVNLRCPITGVLKSEIYLQDMHFYQYMWRRYKSYISTLIRWYMKMLNRDWLEIGGKILEWSTKMLVSKWSGMECGSLHRYLNLVYSVRSLRNAAPALSQPRNSTTTPHHTTVLHHSTSPHWSGWPQPQHFTTPRYSTTLLWLAWWRQLQTMMFYRHKKSSKGITFIS